MWVKHGKYKNQIPILQSRVEVWITEINLNKERDVCAKAINFIKPYLMGRGVDIPMLVILLGAIGGMMMGGIIGLFIGAVLLAFAYKIFQAIVQTD